MESNRRAIEGPVDLPHVYANGFQIGVSNADMKLLLALDGDPVQVIHLSYTLARTLHEKMGAVIEEFEDAVGRKMLTTDEVTAGLSAAGKVTPNQDEGS